MKRNKGIKEWFNEKVIKARIFMLERNEGMGTVEIILIIVDIRGKPKLCKYCLMQMAFR